MLEISVEQYLNDTVALLGGKTYKFVVPGIRGYPDRIVKLPGVSAFLVELKKPKGGRVAELQKVRHEELRAIGWRVYLAKDRGEVDALIEAERAAGRQHAVEVVVAEDARLPPAHRGGRA